MFFSTISAELLRICRATTAFPSFVVTAKTLITRMKKQGADVLGIQNSVRKMLYRHEIEFSKYSTGIETIIGRLLE